MQNRNLQPSSRRLFMMALIPTYIVAAVTLAILLPRQQQRSEERLLDELVTKVESRAQLMESAVSRRLGETAVLAHVRSIQQFASRDPLAEVWPGPGPSPHERLVPLLHTACNELGFTGATVFDDECVPTLAVGWGPDTVQDLCWHVAAAQQQRRAAFVDVYANSSHQLVAYVAPIYLNDGTSVGTLVTTEDPAVQLFGIARISSSGKTTMVSALERKIAADGRNAVEVLWEEIAPLHGANTIELEVATPIERAVADGRSWDGSFTSQDGVERLGAITTVPSTGWGLAVTVASSEAFAEIRTVILLELLLAAAAVPTALAVILLQTERSKRIALEATSSHLAQTDAEIERLNRIMRATRDINQYISHETDIHEVLNKACETVLTIGDFQTSWIALCDSESFAVAGKAGMVETVPTTVTAISTLEHGHSCVYRALKTREPVFVTPSDCSVCTECIHHGGSQWSEVFVGPMVAHGEVVGVLVINGRSLRLSGDREREALIELAADLGFAVVSERFRRQKELAETSLRQAEKMETVGQLAGGIAHDFNNLLTGIIGNVDLAIQDIKDDPATVQLLTDAGTAARRASGLTTKLLTFSRKAVVNPSIIDVDSVIRETMTLLSRSMSATVAVRHIAHEETWPVTVDTTQMTQILLNLAVNARDAMHGAGTLAIEATNTVIDADYVAGHPYARPGEFVVITVSDTGTGMTDEVKKHMFEPFFTTKPIGEGTGLGLSMVFGAVKQAGGWVDVHSTVGVGTSVLIFLPRACREEGTVRQQEATEFARVHAGTENVLVIDDDEIVRTLAQRILERAGYVVVVAAAGAEGLSAFREKKDDISVVLSDLTMPGMNIREVLTQMLALRPDLRIIVSSGHSSTTMRQELSEFPRETLTFLAKPYKPEELLAVVQRVLNGVAGRGTGDLQSGT